MSSDSEECFTWKTKWDWPRTKDDARTPKRGYEEFKKTLKKQKLKWKQRKTRSRDEKKTKNRPRDSDSEEETSDSSWPSESMTTQELQEFRGQDARMERKRARVAAQEVWEVAKDVANEGAKQGLARERISQGCGQGGGQGGGQRGGQGGSQAELERISLTAGGPASAPYVISWLGWHDYDDSTIRHAPENGYSGWHDYGSGSHSSGWQDYGSGSHSSGSDFVSSLKRCWQCGQMSFAIGCCTNEVCQVISKPNKKQQARAHNNACTSSYTLATSKGLQHWSTITTGEDPPHGA
jgi:hypothetical protein